jgi:hypothetical protein
MERDVQVLEVRRWTELVTDRDKWRGTVRDRPKPTAGCSVNGWRRRRRTRTAFCGVPTTYS